MDTFIAGRYQGTWNGSDLGITRDGYTTTVSSEMEDIGESDQFGLSVIDAVYRGGQCFLDFVSMAYKSGPIASIWPFGGTLAGNGVQGILFNPGAGNVPAGILASDLAKAVVLTAAAGTPAAATPATRTFTKALLAKNFDAKAMMNSKLRDLPIRLRAYPYDAGAGVIKFFTDT